MVELLVKGNSGVGSAKYTVLYFTTFDYSLITDYFAFVYEFYI